MALDNNELFDVEFYLGANPDVAKAVAEGPFKSAIQHFTAYGRFERRDPSLLFDTDFYLDTNSDVEAELASGRLRYALRHFTKHGQYEQRDPSPFFNTKFYLDSNPDVALAVGEGWLESPIQHFTLYGIFEGRNPSPLYNNQFYLDSNPDVKAAVTEGQFRSGFDHFMEFGFNEGRIGASRAKIAFSATEFRVIEDGTPVAAVTVDRTDGNIGEVSATVSLSNGTATAPEDYNNTPIEIKFASGETQKTVLIPIVNDNLIEGNETVNLTLGSPQNGATIGEQNTAVLRILDNDGSAVLSRTAGTILSDDSIDVFLPSGGELTLEVTVTVPGDGSTPATVSVSPSSFALKKAAKLASVDTSTPEITFAATAAPPQLPLDVFLLQDLSGSFDDDLPKLRELVPNLIPALKTRQPDTTFGFGSFIDKPIDPFGINGDYVYRLNQKQTTDSTQLEQQVNQLTVIEGSGGDDPEAQLEALLQIARRTVASNENGFRNGARHVVVVSTDNSYHIEGDGVQGNITLPNNGDTIIDPQEDYPNVGQVRQALIDADIVPVFAVTDDEDNISIYNNLINQLGFGKVVQLQSDSRNLVDAITEGLGAVESEINIFSVSDDFGYVKEILPAKFTGVLAGETRTFTVKLKSDGRGGDDSLILRALGYGDTKVNIFKIDPYAPLTGSVTAGDGFPISEIDNLLENGFQNTQNEIIVGTLGVNLLTGVLGGLVPVVGPFIATGATALLSYNVGQSLDKSNQALNDIPYGKFPDEIETREGKNKIDKTNRDVSLIPISPVNPNKPVETWIVIHGWNDGPSGDMYKLAEQLRVNKPNAQILFLNWEEAATNGKLAGENNLDALLRFGNYFAAKWIRPVAEFAVKELRKLGIGNKEAIESLNLIGHSLGSLVAAEIGSIYKADQVDSQGKILEKGEGVNTIIALDPPSQTDLDVIKLFGIGNEINNLVDGFGYDVDGRNTIADPPKIFSQVSKLSRAFVGARSIAGNQNFAAGAHESFQMDFGNTFDTGDEHGYVVQTFTELLKQNSEIVDLILNDKSFDARQNTYIYDQEAASRGLSHEGIIKVNAPNQPSFLVVKNANTSSNDDDIVYGSTGDDKLDGSNINIFGLSVNGDPLYTGSGNDKFYGDAGNDVIVGDSGNDTIYGNQGNDTLYGNQDTDLIYGGKNDDVIYGGQGNDILFGDQGSDFLNGDLGDDVLYGGDDKDQDTLTGGLGNDVFILKSGNGLPTSDEANIDKVDIIQDFRKGVPLFPVGGVDVRGVSRIGLIDGLKREQIGVQFIGNLLDTFGQKTVIFANGEYLAVLNGGWFSQSDLQLTELPLS